jgi:hypothetical protein
MESDDNTYDELIGNCISTSPKKAPWTDQWQDNFEELICVQGDHSQVMGSLCMFTSDYYKSKRTWLLGPAACLSWSLNIFGIVVTFIGAENISNALVILINSLFNFVIATLTTIAEKNNAGSNVELYIQFSREYMAISDNITQEISKHPAQRKVMAHAFLEEVTSEYNDIWKRTPHIPSDIVDLFNKRTAHLESMEHISHIVHKPYMCEPITATSRNRNPWYKEVIQDNCDSDKDKYAQIQLTLLGKENTKNIDTISQLQMDVDYWKNKYEKIQNENENENEHSDKDPWP